MFKYFKLKKRIKDLEDILEEERAAAIDLAADLEDTQKEVTAIKVIEKILGQTLEFENITSKSVDHQRNYYHEAQNVLNNDVFKNEVNKYISQLVDHIAKRAKSYEEVQALRYSINGVEALRERLRSIVDPDAMPEPKRDNIHSAL